MKEALELVRDLDRPDSVQFADGTQENGWGILEDILDGRPPTPVEQKAKSLKYEVISLSDAVEHYIDIRGKTEDRKFLNSVRGSLAFFVDNLGDKPINGYRRKEVWERLLSGIRMGGRKTATVARRLSDIRAAVNQAILDFEYEFNNPFEKQTIPNLREDEESRTSLTPIQHDGLIQLFSKGEYGDTLNGLRMLFDTGMRVSELVGSRTEDVLLDHEIPHIRLQRNPFRSLKTKQSQRLIPLIGYALEGARRQLDVSNEWLFPRYIDHGRQQVKNDSASAAMNKRLKPLGFTCHSLRHNLKDRLRRANVSMDNIKELQGWSRVDQASRYGEMSLLELLAVDMAKINVWSDPWDF